MPIPHDMSRAFNRAVVDEFRANGGRLADPRFKDVRLVLLTTTGARTGRPHTTPLAYFTDGPGRIVLWASAMAAPAHPAWYHNLVADPRVTIELGDSDGRVESFGATAWTAVGAERNRLHATLEAHRPDIAVHQNRTERQIPLVVVEYDPVAPLERPPAP